MFSYCSFTGATEQLLQQSAANGEEASELHAAEASRHSSQVNGEQQDERMPTKAECIERGVECIGQADVDGAESNLRQAIVQDPRNAAAWCHYYHVLKNHLLQGNRSAQSQLKTVLVRASKWWMTRQDSPDRALCAGAFCVWGLGVQYGLGDMDEALEIYKQANQIDKTHALLFYNHTCTCWTEVSC